MYQKTRAANGNLMKQTVFLVKCQIVMGLILMIMIMMMHKKRGSK